MTSTMSLNDLAQRVGGRLVGSGDVLVTKALPLQDADQHSITLADDIKHATAVENSPAPAVVVQQELPGCTKSMLIVEDLHKAFAQIIGYLRPATAAKLSGIDPSAHIDRSAQVGTDTTISANVSIGADCVLGSGCTIHSGVQLLPGCRVGDDCVLFPGVVLYPSTILGDRVLIHAAAILGPYGFGYRLNQGRHERTAQLGWVEVGNDVEIGAGTTIDRGTYGPTKIGDGTKIDNQVQIGHNCHIGKHNLICAQVGIAGSCSTGDYVVMAGQAGLADHLQLGDNVVIAAQTGVMRDTEQGVTLFGSPAGPLKQKMQEIAMVGRLPEMRRELRSLKKQMAAMEDRLLSTDGVDSPARHVA